MDIGICLAMLAVLPFLYFVFGQAFFLLFRQKISSAMCLLSGVFVYYTVFQAAALPLVLAGAPLLALTVLWGIAVALVLVCWALLRRKRASLLPGRMCGARLGQEYGGARSGQVCGEPLSSAGRFRMRRWIFALMLLAVLAQLYFVISNEYLGWDTSFYVGTIATSVEKNSMYRYNGESGWPADSLPMRYALSSFYMHAAVWCQALRLPAVDYAKIVQGGTLVVLANMVVFQLGRFFFSTERYRDFSEQKKTECAAAMVVVAVAVNFFYRSIYTTSDFLLNRALEAKGYCANFILPFLFLLGLWMWRDCRDRGTRTMLFLAALGSVPISMSALVSAPALIFLMLLPVLLRERSWKILRLCLVCVLPNAVYLAVYLLSEKGLIVVGV